MVFRNNTIEGYDVETVPYHGWCEPIFIEDLVFCKSPLCCSCESDLESATIHADCLQLFSRACTSRDKYYRLWAASLALLPWLGCRPPNLPYSCPLPNGIRFAEKVLGVSIWGRLPGEIVLMIMDFLGRDITRRYSIVADRAAVLSKPPRHVEEEQFSLDRILSWHRESGRRPVIIDDLSTAPLYLRVKIDSHGIYQIERLFDFEKGATTRRHQLFVAEPAEKLAQVQACFQVCSPDKRVHMLGLTDITGWPLSLHCSQTYDHNPVERAHTPAALRIAGASSTRGRRETFLLAAFLCSEL